MNPSDKIKQPWAKSAGTPVPELASLREISPPPSLIARVMREVGEPAPFRFWDWVRGRRRFEISLSPLGIAAGTFVLAVFALGLTWDARVRHRDLARGIPAASAIVDGAVRPDVVLVRFVITARGAQRVSLAGDFNGWDPEATALSQVGGDGTFAATVQLPRDSTQEYMFVVDGQWTPDPASEHFQPDGFGRQNSVLRL